MRKSILKKAFLVVLTLIVCAAGVHAVPIVAFDSNPTNGTGPLTVNFFDRSTWNGTAVAWQWQFGDGSPNSTQQNPVYTYMTLGNFTVNLTVRDLEGVNTTSGRINVTWGAQFFNLPNAGEIPLNVTFTDLSIGAVAWNWSFGDGSPNVTGTNTTNHVYNIPGTYTSMLTVLNGLGNSSTATADIVALAPPDEPTQNLTYVSPNTMHFGTKVLVYTDQNLTLPNGTEDFIGNRSVCRALQALNYSFTATDEHNVFFSQLVNNGPWNLVIMDEEKWDPDGSNPTTGVANYTLLTNYVTGGGKAIVSTANMEIYPTDPLWTAMGVQFPGFAADPVNYMDKIVGTNGTTYVWNRNDGGAFTSPFNITSPILFNGSPMMYDLNGYNVTNLTGTRALGGNNTTFRAGGAHFVAGNNNKTIFNAILPSTFINQTLAIQLYENEINSILKPTKIGNVRGNKWYIDRDGDGAFTAVDKSFSFGLGTWVPISGDWNGTGFDGMASYNPAGKYWLLDTNNDYLSDFNVTNFTTNITTPIPVAGDWTGNGTTKVGIFNNVTKTWYLDMNRNFVWDAGDRSFVLSGGGYVQAVNDSPVTGRWNGTNITTYGIYRGGQWFLDTTADGIIDTTYTNFLTNATYGNETGDWTGNGTTKIGVSRAGQWWLDTNSNGLWDVNDTYIPNFLTNLTQTAQQRIQNVTGNLK